MPELPDITVYIESLDERLHGRVLERVRVTQPNLLRTAEPPLAAVEGARLTGLRRLGKRIAMGFDGGCWLVLHLMVAGRLHWRDRGVKLRRKLDSAAFDFENGSLVLSEAGSKKRASLHVVAGAEGLQSHDPGGLEVIGSSGADFAGALERENHTLKRALTDPRLFSGIGNAYSDEILHRARLSPVKMTNRLNGEEVERLHKSAREVLEEWTGRLRKEAAGGFPEKVTAFRPEMAVHGRYGQPCPDCGSPVQRIRYADNETNYCPQCQTGGKLLADRVLSRLLKKDWPRTPEELEELRRR
ncbi:MAG: DNA-formamidopyrimidine glycosylase family protein [Candidatus Latescibacterota bacterium]|jgi:formamidopyrimidine-DNA glycosylase